VDSHSLKHPSNCNTIKRPDKWHTPFEKEKKLRSLPVSRVLSWTVIHLGYASLRTSSNLPGSSAGHAYRNPIWSCSEWGLPCRGMLPPTRCALTAPFQPYRYTEVYLGGIFSAALSVDSRRPDVIWHSTLWSPDFPPSFYKDSDCLANSSARILTERFSFSDA